MNKAIATIQHIRGETITFGLRAVSPDPAYDSTEAMTCAVKLAVNGNTVPAASAPVVQSITPSFSSGAWLFNITPAQSAAMAAGNYITDARVAFTGGFVDYADPLGITIFERVTA